MALLNGERILEALRTVDDPDLHRDLVTLGMIEDLAIEGGAVVASRWCSPPSACPLKEQIEGEARAAVQAVPGVERRGDQDHLARAQAPDPSADRKALAGVAHVIAVGSGKGGVGKSTVARQPRGRAGAPPARASACSTATSTGRTCRACWACTASPSQRTARSCRSRRGACTSCPWGCWSTRARRWCGAGRCCTARSRASCTTWTGASSTTCSSTCRPAPATCSSR